MGEFSIESMCRVFGVTTSGHYVACTRGDSARMKEDQQLAEQITTLFVEKRRCYGSWRIHKELRRGGTRVARKRVARLMQQQGLRASAPRRWVKTTDSSHNEPIAPNLLQRDFTATEPDKIWAGDITYIRTAEGWLYLAMIIDLYSRQIIGWAMSDRITQELACSALQMALDKRTPTGTLIFHTDRGVQYAAGEYRQLLKDWSITPSMSRRGNCYDNAVSESVFATLKKELVYRQTYRTHEEAKASLFEYIEVFYNRERLHSTIGYVSPVEYEETWSEQHKATQELLSAGPPLATAIKGGPVISSGREGSEKPAYL